MTTETIDLYLICLRCDCFDDRAGEQDKLNVTASVQNGRPEELDLRFYLGLYASETN